MLGVHTLLRDERTPPLLLLALAPVIDEFPIHVGALNEAKKRMQVLAAAGTYLSVALMLAR